LYKILFVSLVFIFSACELTNKDYKSKDLESINDCYEEYGVDNLNFVKNNLYVVVDQTFILDEHLKEHVLKKIQPLLRSATSINIIKFSTFSEGYYTSVVLKETIVGKLTQKQRDDVAKRKLKKLDKCLQYKKKEKQIRIPKVIRNVLNESNETIGHSEIFKTLMEVSNLYRFKKAKGNKIIVLISDMLENSSITSFYSNNSIKNIETKIEFLKIKKAGYLPNFRDASIYIIGAGLLSQKARTKKNSNNKKLYKLKQFWTKYFKEAKSTLYGFGMPELLGSIE